jgi:ribonucleoside-diphosphate reductase beta chain
MLNWDDPLAPLTNQQSATATAVEPAAPAEPAPKPHPEANPLLSNRATPQPVAAPLDTKPVNPDDKRVVNGLTDVNQLAPFKYPWAWEYFLNANKNHWTPLDINMAQDVHDYHHKLTLEERHIYENVLSYLTTSDILAMRNIGLAVM